jgi:hypothetical protein
MSLSSGRKGFSGRDDFPTWCIEPVSSECKALMAASLHSAVKSAPVYPWQMLANLQKIGRVPWLVLGLGLGVRTGKFAEALRDMYLCKSTDCSTGSLQVKACNIVYRAAAAGTET